jgi:hypothetical protein
MLSISKKISTKNKLMAVLALLFFMQVNNGNASDTPVLPPTEHSQTSVDHTNLSETSKSSCTLAVEAQVPQDAPVPISVEFDTLQNRDTFILRLGSSPETKHYMLGVNDKHDNTYQALVDGSYARKLALLGIPLRNIAHVHIVEEQHYADKWETMPYYWYLSSESNVVNIVADFNSERFLPLVETVLQSLAAPTPKVDLIITDDKVAKFIRYRSTVLTFIGMLKSGGVLVITDLDENYDGERYDPCCMFCKLTPESFTLGLEQHGEPRQRVDQMRKRYGLMDLMFNSELEATSQIAGPIEHEIDDMKFTVNFFPNRLAFFRFATAKSRENLFPYTVAHTILPLCSECSEFGFMRQGSKTGSRIVAIERR